MRRLAVLAPTVAIVVLLVGCAPTPPGTPPLRAVCVGDSITDPEYPWIPHGTGWCERLAAMAPLANVALWNAGRTGVFARHIYLYPKFDGPALLATAIQATAPAIALIALGTNDIARGRFDAPTVAQSILDLVGQATAAGVLPLVLAVPPVARTDFPGEPAESAQVNDLLRAALPPWQFIDASYDPAANVVPDPDGIHLNAAGQAVRLFSVLAHVVRYF